MVEASGKSGRNTGILQEKSGGANLEEEDEGPMMKAFMQALGVGDDTYKAARDYAEANRTNVRKILNCFSPDGKLTAARLPASCYNDLYKWTMFPVVTTAEKAFDGITCTFSVNIRDAGYRQALVDSATSETDTQLYDSLKEALAGMKQRPFDRRTFETCTSDLNVPGWDDTALDKVCGGSDEPRMLVDEFRADAPDAPSMPSGPGKVLLETFVAMDQKLKEKRVWIEATGPWHRVTWLETTMMQCVYDVLLRDRKRSEYGGESDDVWYPKWLAEAFVRCTRSVEAAVQSGLKGAIFAGRRTGGLALMMLQGIYAHHAFRDKDGASMLLGSSSVLSCYLTRDLGVSQELIPVVAGTHAHELSMVIGACLGEVDDKAGMPLSQIIGHMLYFYRSRPLGDVAAEPQPGRRSWMPMLPDTLGTKAFMKTASKLKVPKGVHRGQGVLEVIGAARQDSGTLEGFTKLMEEYGYTGGLMASEIETADDLMTAAKSGYSTFGAGGFMGDSEKAWDKSRSNISMACKVLRVYVGPDGSCKKVESKYSPVKTGETADGVVKEAKFEADGTLTAEQVSEARERAQILAAAEPKLSDDDLQALFEQTLNKMLQEPAEVAMKSPALVREFQDPSKTRPPKLDTVLAKMQQVAQRIQSQEAPLCENHSKQQAEVQEMRATCEAWKLQSRELWAQVRELRSNLQSSQKQLSSPRSPRTPRSPRSPRRFAAWSDWVQ